MNGYIHKFILILTLPGTTLLAQVSIHWPPGQTTVKRGSKCTFTVEHADKLPHGWRWFITGGAHGDLVGTGGNQALFTAPVLTHNGNVTIRVEDIANTKDFCELVVPVVLDSMPESPGVREKKEPIGPLGGLGDYFKSESGRFRQNLSPDILASADRLEQGILPIDESEIAYWPGIPNAFRLCYMNVEIKMLARLPALDSYIVDNKFDAIELANIKAKLRKMINLVRGGRKSPANQSKSVMAYAQMEFLEAIYRYRISPATRNSLFSDIFVDFESGQKLACQFRLDLMVLLGMEREPELCFEGYVEIKHESESKEPRTSSLETTLITTPVLPIPAMVGLHGNLKSSNQAFEKFLRPLCPNILVAPPFFMAEYERYRVASSTPVIDHQPMRLDPTLVLQLSADPTPPGPGQAPVGRSTPVTYETVYTVFHVGGSGLSGHFIGYAKGSDGAWYENNDDEPTIRRTSPPQEALDSQGLPQSRFVSVLYAKVGPDMSTPNDFLGGTHEVKAPGVSSSSSSPTGYRPRTLAGLPSEIHTRISELAGTAPGFRNVSRHFNEVARNTPDRLTTTLRINDKGLIHLLKARPKLKAIRLRGKGKLTNEGIIRALGQCPDLQDLDIAEGCLEFAEILDLFRTHEHLTGLRHRGTLSDQQLAQLPARMEALRINSESVQDETIRRFDALKILEIREPSLHAFKGDRLPDTLTELALLNCRDMTGKGLPPHLVRLTIQSAPYFDGSFVLPQLQQLTLEYCDELSLGKLRNSLLSSPLLTQFSSQRINTACLAALPARVTHLSLMNCGLVQEGAFARFTRLEALSVHGAGNFSGAHLPSTLRKLKAEICQGLRSENLGALPLTHLDVNYCPGVTLVGLPPSLVELIIDYHNYHLHGH